MISKLFAQLIKRKFTAGILLLLVAGSGYWGYTKIFSNDGAIRYATAQVQKGTLIVSISGSGQVSASNQVDVKPKASGNVVYVGVKNGQEIKAGALIAQLDARDAQKSVRDAEANLESAKLSLEKFKFANSKEKLEVDLKKTYENGFNAVSDAFLDLPAVMTGLDDLLFGNNITSSQTNINFYSDAIKSYDEKIILYKDDTLKSYQTARKNYDQNFADYKSVSRFSDEASIEKIINQTYDTVKIVAEAIKNTYNFIQFYKDKLTERALKSNSLADTHLSSLNTYTGKINNHLTNLFSVNQTIEDKKDAFINADLDLKSQELSVRQRENSLLDVKEKLADYSVRAPFGGVIAQLQLKKGDSISPSTVLGILITKQKIAEVSLNEIDVAKVKAGQKVTLTFDAVPDLTITGQVAEVDAVGTVSQGVVTYTVKIGFDTQDDRVKTAMSVSAAIVTEAKPNVVLIPNSAVKSQSGMSYVEIVDGDDQNLALAANASGAILKNIPRRQQIEVGAASDEFTEIINGLNEGDIIVTRTIQPTAQTTQTQQQSGGLRIPGLPGGGGSGGGFRGGGGTPH